MIWHHAGTACLAYHFHASDTCTDGGCQLLVQDLLLFPAAVLGEEVAVHPLEAAVYAFLLHNLVSHAAHICWCPMAMASRPKFALPHDHTGPPHSDIIMDVLLSLTSQKGSPGLDKTPPCDR